VIYLDTHAVVWLYQKDCDRFTARGIDYLSDRLNLTVCTRPFPKLAVLASNFKWTRDSFDRIITAQAAIKDSLLLTKDRTILKHYPGTVW
jgi:PIN domain nuclease of toxin-antitoxin system